MKLHASANSAINLVTALEPKQIFVNGIGYKDTLIVLPNRVISGWTPRTPESLEVQDFETLCALECPIILLGTGMKQLFPASNLLRPLSGTRTGLEVMSTAAACRTYNILAGEGRKVAAALLF